MSNKNQPTINLIKQFHDLVQDGMESWIKAGDIIVQLIDVNDMTMNELMTHIPSLNKEVIKTFERLGRKQLLPELLISKFPATSQLKQANYSDQIEVMTNGIEVLTSKGDKLIVKAENLTASQCRQVFYNGTVRSLAAQKSYIESCRSKDAEVIIETEKPAYTVKKGKVIIHRPTELSSKELLNILSNAS